MYIVVFVVFLYNVCNIVAMIKIFESEAMANEVSTLEMSHNTLL